MKFKLSGEQEFWLKLVSVLCIISVFLANVVPSTVPTIAKSEVSAPQQTAPASEPQFVSAQEEPAHSQPPESTAPEPPAATSAEPPAQLTEKPAEPLPPESRSESSADSASSQAAASTAEPAQTTAPQQPPEESEPEKLLVNINTAALSELMQLNGIGEVKGKAIIAYREQHGAFSSVDELLNVKGIGEKTLEKLRDNVTV